jgi:hypothetical protein
VSQRVPGLHAYLPIADPGAALHSPAFAEAARSERGKAVMRAGAIALAQTALDLAYQPEARKRAKGEMG